jgi:hypothetical protein
MSSPSISLPSSPVSASSTITEERSARTMADAIKNYGAPIISKTSKWNMRKNLSRHIKKAKLEEECAIQINEKPTTLNIRDDSLDDQDNDDNERSNIFYNLKKVS